MRLPSLVLALAALTFVGFGLAFLLAPGLLALVELTPASPAARSDVRAVYGGIELGIGVFLGLCARRAAWLRPGLAVQALALGGAVVGRLASLAADGVPGPLTLALGTLELSGAILALAALRRLPPTVVREPPGA